MNRMENNLDEPLLLNSNDEVEESLQQQTILDALDIISTTTSSINQQQPAAALATTLLSNTTPCTTPLSVLNDDDDENDNPWKNHNVILSFASCIVSGIADSIWTTVVLSGFLLALAGKMGQSKDGNTLVGGAEAGQGLTQLVTALPVGYLADTFGKSKIVRLGGILMLVTIALTMGALIDVKRHADESTAAAKRSYIMLAIALALWGIIAGIANGPSQALFSDSVPKGKRSELLTWLFACYMMSSTVGPIVSIVLILTVSAKAEVWSINEMYPVFLLGVMLEIPAAILMLFFNDKYSVAEANEETNPRVVATDDEEAAPLCSDVVENGSVKETIIANGDCTRDEIERPGEIDTSHTAETHPPIEADPSTPISTTNDRKAIIPYVLFASSLISSLGSGASVKYFPLFFKEVGFGSAAVQGIFLVVPVSISFFSFIAQEAGKRFGRVETTFVTIVLGVGLLFLMTALSHNLQTDHDNGVLSDVTSNNTELSSSSLWDSNPYKAMFIVIVYLFRTGIINSCYPLLESILMDNVPSNQRARWKSLESIASFGWTGSALVGGILSDEHSYQFTFAMTAWMQLVSAFILLIIQPLVESE